MPYKSGKLKGELTTPEIRKLISAHNKLTDIKIKKGATRDDIIKLLKNSGWSVDHEKQSLIPLDRPRKKIITLKEAKEVTKPKPKTELQKQKLKEKKEEKEVEKKKEVREIKKKAIQEQKSIPKKVPKGSHKMPDGSIMKNKDMSKKDSNPFIGKSTAPNAKPTYKPKSAPEKKTTPKPKPPVKKEAPRGRRKIVASMKKGTYSVMGEFVLDFPPRDTGGTWEHELNKYTKKDIPLLKITGFSDDGYSFVGDFWEYKIVDTNKGQLLKELVRLGQRKLKQLKRKQHQNQKYQL